MYENNSEPEKLKLSVAGFGGWLAGGLRKAYTGAITLEEAL